MIRLIKGKGPTYSTIPARLVPSSWGKKGISNRRLASKKRQTSYHGQRYEGQFHEKKTCASERFGSSLLPEVKEGWEKKRQQRGNGKERYEKTLS